MKKKLLGLLLCLTLGLGLTSCKKEKNESLDYVSLRINPEIEMLVDEDGNVVDAAAINDDGEEVLEDTEFEGLSIYEASILFTNRSIELGFVDKENGNATLYVGTATDQEGNESLNVNINAGLAKYFAENNINIKISREEIKINVNSSDSNNSLTSEIIISRLLAINPSLDKNDLEKMSFQELVNLMKEEHNELKELTKEQRKEYRNQIKELHQKYSYQLDIKKTIDDLLAQLECATISDESKALIQIQLEAIKSMFDEEQYEQYEAELNVIVGNFINVNVGAKHHK